jgi:cytochrome c biogenesis protein CcdA/thiol-disulfide isomerase/thioredoxin
MALLVVFAFLAGAGTALSPCVLPVLPALLSAGATGGRRRPLGIVTGLAITFTVTIVGLATVVDGVGLGDSITRTIAIVALFGFGIAIAVPAVGDRLEAPLSRLARFGPRSGGRGFWSGILVGGALGFVYAPCAGPILAAVVSVSAASGHTIAVGLAYSVGSAVVLLVLALAGRTVADRVRRAGRGPTLQRVLGGVMVATALAMALQLDVSFQSAIADHLPAAVVNPTRSLEESHAVAKRLDDLRRPSQFARAARPDSPLKDYGAAPDFTGNERWFNTPGNRPLKLAGLRGHVVLIDFWTYTCINCLRTLPHLTAWDETYRRAGLTIVGVHSPEFDFEKNASNVAAAIGREGIRYPVAQDNAMATWDAWGNQYWPAEYLIDARGHVRHVNFGEGDYDGTEAAIRSLLREAGAQDLGGDARPRRSFDPAARATPETYLGAARAERYTTPVALGTVNYSPTPDDRLGQNEFTLGGRWTISDEAARAGAGATLTGRVTGKDVYLVLSPPVRGTGTVQVALDGHPIPAAAAGRDVHGGTVTVTNQRLYHLVSRPKLENHVLSLRFSDGTAGYAFTFG